jgi:hypothetical protein
MPAETGKGFLVFDEHIIILERSPVPAEWFPTLANIGSVAVRPK